mgnify:CR=1 FL=1
MSSLRYLPATTGTLVKLRERLQLVRRGKEVLEMRRDQLIKEVYNLLSEIRKREELEKELYQLYERIKEIYATIGPDNISSYARTISKPKIRVIYESLFGVRVPRVDFLNVPDFTQISHPAVYQLALELWSLMENLFKIAAKEMAVESLSNELAYINRVVNSLEKNVIPQLIEQIHYVEERIREESLSEFVRIKKVRDVIQKRRE